MPCIRSVPVLSKHCDRCLIGKWGCKFDGWSIGEDSGKGKVRASVDDEDRSDKDAPGDIDNSAPIFPTSPKMPGLLGTLKKTFLGKCKSEDLPKPHPTVKIPPFSKILSSSLHPSIVKTPPSTSLPLPSHGGSNEPSSSLASFCQGPYISMGTPLSFAPFTSSHSFTSNSEAHVLYLQDQLASSQEDFCLAMDMINFKDEQMWLIHLHHLEEK